MRLVEAVRFLTVVRLPGPAGSLDDVRGSTVFFPIVGAALGLVLMGIDYGLGFVWSRQITSALTLVALILLTGGMHLDGLMDSCDGLFGRSDPAKRLEIMRDSRVGSFGVLGAIAVLMIKYAALIDLSDPFRMVGILAMPMLGRWGMTLAIWTFPYGRPSGLGSPFKQGLRWPQLTLAGLFCLAVAYAVLGLRGVAAFATVCVLALLVGRLICGRIPGLTGDSYGAINEVGELGMLLALVAMQRFV